MAPGDDFKHHSKTVFMIIPFERPFMYNGINIGILE